MAALRHFPHPPTKVNKCETNGMNPYQLIIYVRDSLRQKRNGPGARHSGFLLHNVSD